MLRVGTHYVEARRIAYFVVEGAFLWVAFVLGQAGVALATGVTPGPAWLVDGLVVVTALEGGFYFADLHDLRVGVSDAPSGRRTLRALAGPLFLLAAALAVGWGKEQTPALVAGLGTATVLALGLRSSLPELAAKLVLRTRVFLVGEGRAARMVVREISRDGGAEVVGFGGPRTTDIASRARAAGADTIVVATDDRRGLPTTELLRCRAAGLDVVDAATLAARVLHRLPVELIRPSDLIFADGFGRPWHLRAAHRALSVGVTLVMLAVLWPLLLAVAILVKLDSKGPVFYRQIRTGKDGKPFEMVKFRTMATDAEASGVKWAQKDDPRVTRIGKHLRRYRIDELPQLWNVLRGDMDLVGPRPERPEFVMQLCKRIPYFDLRHLVAPGITGYAQVCYPYAASIEEAKEKLQYDLYYVRHLSLWLDLYVVLMTAKVVLFGRGAR